MWKVDNQNAAEKNITELKFINFLQILDSENSLNSIFNILLFYQSFYDI